MHSHRDRALWLGVAVGVLVGLFFALGGVALRPRRSKDEVQTVGRVVESRSGYACGEPALFCTIEFHDTGGRVCRFEPRFVGPREPKIGEQFRVAFLAAAPEETARRIDGLDGHVHTFLLIAGLMTAAAFLVMALV